MWSKKTINEILHHHRAVFVISLNGSLESKIYLSRDNRQLELNRNNENKYMSHKTASIGKDSI